MCYDNYNSINDFSSFLNPCFVIFSEKAGFILSISGIICEYNPFHLGHQKQIDHLRSQGHKVVCLMSGNFVQRGHPAIFDKMARAQAAVRCGADLVLELPVQYALSSAEGFACGGVEILSKLCDTVCFGAETADRTAIMDTARVLLQPAFSHALREQLGKGLSFPAARQSALTALGVDGALVQTPNNILAVEYCKAILAQNSQLVPLPIHRGGDYHDPTADDKNPSATSLRFLIQNNEKWADFVPKQAYSVLKVARKHFLEQGEKAILAKLRTMTHEEFEALPYGTEGLWRKLMHASRQQTSLEEIIAATKSKRYTRTRIDRMILCAFLGLTAEDLATPAPYCRILAFNDTGREILAGQRENNFFINIGTDTRHPYQAIEHRVTSLYGLFAETTEAPDAASRYRVCYHREAT